MAKLRQLFGSRKFWALVVGLAYFIVGQLQPDIASKLPAQEQAIGIVVLIVGYILGTAIEDGLRG